MGRHQHHAELVGGQHHRHVHVAGEMGKPFCVSWIRKAREMERVLVGGTCHDGIDFAVECELDRVLDGVAGDAARADDTMPIVSPFAAAELPTAGGQTPHIGNGHAPDRPPQ